jgi:Right handed beta helix region
MTRITLGIAAGLALAAVLPTAPAHAQNGTLTRSFVSSTGLDSNACTVTAPCATFAQAYTKVGADGIIAALDPGKYGPILISSSVTINGNGWAAITGSTSSSTNYSGITVDAGAGTVILKGLEIDGGGTSTTGIYVYSFGSLTITDCSVQNFTGTGIALYPDSNSGTALNVTITNTTVSNNAFGGIRHVPPSGATATATIVIDHVLVSSNTGAPGIAINTTAESGGGPTTVAILNSISSGDPTEGVLVNGDPLTVTIDNTDILGNGVGVRAQGGTFVYMGRSVITANTNSGVANAIPNDFFTYGDNRINGNGAIGGNDVTMNSLVSASQQ